MDISNTFAMWRVSTIWLLFHRGTETTTPLLIVMVLKTHANVYSKPLSDITMRCADREENKTRSMASAGGEEEEEEGAGILSL